MKISLTIDAANAAFDGEAGYEVTCILEVLSMNIKQGYVDLEVGSRYPVRDSNGNRVGFFTVKS